jgi:cation-transporting P-type ATPase 13A2
MGKKIIRTQDYHFNAKREDLEKNLEFIGFLAFENELKPDSKECIERLLKAKLDCKVISGDNPLTSIQCARECSILDFN